jgi:hypothetical protein
MLTTHPATADACERFWSCKGSTLSRAVLAVALTFGCAGGDGERAAGEVRACGFEFSSAETDLTARPSYLGLETTLGVDLPHVLGVRPGEDGIDFRVDGLPALAEVAEASTRVVYTDSVGRDVEFDLCVGAAGSGRGEVKRCNVSGCEHGEVVVRPLTLNPVAPDQAAGAGLADTAGYELVAEYQGPDWPAGASIDLQVDEAIAVLVRGQDGLRVLGLGGEGGTPVDELSHLAPEDGDFWNDVKLFDGRYALVASRRSGLIVVDLSEPSLPHLVGTSLSLGARANGHNLFVRDNVAYLARSAPGGGVTLLDLAEPASPGVLHEWTLPGCEDVHDVYVTETEVYVNCFDFGLLVVDASDPTAPEVLARYEQPFSHSTWVTTIDARKLVLFSAEGFATAVELAELDPDAGLVSLGAFSFGSAASIHNLECVADRCFVSAYQEGWFEVDVSQPSLPAVERGAPTWDGPGVRFLEGASGIAVAGERVFVADTERGFLLYERTRSGGDP